MQAFLARHRIGVSRAFFAVAFALIFLTVSAWEPSDGATLVLCSVGFVLLSVAALGRLWCSIYICGYKNKRVIQDGPYSVVRNPLYCFSLLGGVGVGFIAGSLVVTALILIFFICIYPMTIRNEEEILERKLGQDYLDYKARTPRLVPAFKQFRNVEEYTINIRQMQSAFSDAIWFLAAAPILLLVDLAHRSGMLPQIASLF